MDLGCNDGGISYMLTKAGHIVYGVDLPEIINIAKRKYNHPNLNFISIDLSDQFPFEKNLLT